MERLPQLTALLPVIPALVIAISFHYFFLRRPGPVGFDDGYTVAIGERLIDGRWLPYVDGASHRGPLLYFIAALGQWTFGRFTWEAPRLLMLLCSLVTLGGMTGLGILARAPLFGSIAALVWAWLALAVQEPGTAFGLNGEPIAGCLVTLALVAQTAGFMRAPPGRGRLLWLALAGVLCSLAGFTKQTALPLYAPILAWTFAAALTQPGLSTRDRLAPILASLAGFLAPALVIVLRYWLSGELATFWYWFFTYNAEVYMQPVAATPLHEAIAEYARKNPWPVGVVVALVTFSVVRPVFEAEPFPRGLLRAYATHGLEVTLALCTAAAFIAFASPKRFWGSYHVLVYPFLALVVGMRAHALFAQARGSPVARACGHLALGVLFAGALGTIAHLKLGELVTQRRQGGWAAGRPDPMCAIVEKYTSDGDSLFIWGFESDLYISCRRHVGARYTYSTLVAGTVPPAWAEQKPERVARDSRRLLLEDLQASSPKLILDLPARMGNVSLRTVPELKQWIDERYCAPTTERLPRHGTLYLRRDQPGCVGAVERKFDIPSVRMRRRGD
ncbi:MAG: hypothetical protein KF718_01465 [Polyangiaceae bacterium]|nr:hypothetical protein [Polyangiaceae bacterium]